ncbi:Retrovirus-related Pol polyprotein LINE-1 [Gossypium australe]|uniref:Retrovirus-related Pol polyprotein LINE-1 n=1 Tax=Gossypium australe TaxID=47621 RepID=A0A5B6WYH5_9ROSI|nr:Retrovirus-related Pol polyprotein LINE-1 [Gossypium australe]
MNTISLSSIHVLWNDDLVIFSQADLVHSGLLKDFLNNFCDLSGHKVNARKTNVFFSAGVNEPLRKAMNDIFGFQEVNDLGHYLGVPLFHRRVTNSILHFLVERVRSRLSNWDAKRLSFVGRVTLAHSVLLSIPSYFMQSTLVPKGICNSIEELMRQFIWGAADGKRKMALVGWDDICQPKVHDGLDLRCLEDKNKAFILKIGYNLITKTEAIWVKVLRAKYGWGESMPESIMRKSCSYMWKAVAKA